MNNKDAKFNLLVLNYQEKLFNYLFKLLSNKEDAEDTLQKVFIAFYEKMETVNKKAYETYLFRSAYNGAVSIYKKRSQKSNFFSICKVNKKLQHNNEEISLNISNNAVNKALLDLSLRERNVIELKVFQNKSYKSIAKIMNTTDSAIDSLLVRAKRKLRKKLSKEIKVNKKIEKQLGV